MSKLLNLLALALLMMVLVVQPALAPLDSQAQRSSNPTVTTTIQNLVQPNPTQIWGSGGTVMFAVAAQVTASRNPPGQNLNSQQKQFLRPQFGDLVDQVQVNYNAKLLDRWSNGTQTIHVGAVDSTAQAYCNRLYLRDRYHPHDTAQLILLAHELTHAQQCARLGGVHRFGYQYFAAYQQANQQYAKNQFEKEAHTGEQQFIKGLCQQINCQNPRGKYYINYQGVNVKLPISLP